MLFQNSVMENLTKNVNRWLSTESQIQQLKAENNILLQRVKQLETKINREKQQNKTPCKTDEKTLNAMVGKSLKMLARVQTLESIGMYRLKQRQLDRSVEKRYIDLMDRFLKRLYYKRQQRLLSSQRLFHLDFRICK